MVDRTEPWHLDKRIPIALILAIIIQSGGAVWWISGIVHRLDSAMEANTRQDSRLGTLESAMNATAVNSATMSAQLTAVRESLTELKAAQAETNRLLRNLSSDQ